MPLANFLAHLLPTPRCFDSQELIFRLQMSQDSGFRIHFGFSVVGFDGCDVIYNATTVNHNVTLPVKIFRLLLLTPKEAVLDRAG
jgi:hypothetical protein